MTKKWYPVIDYTVCIECGACITKCNHGVYDKTKAPGPVVINHESCIDHCHGCGNLCPTGAITYVGDDTGWNPLNKKETAKEAVSCCDNERKYENRVLIEYLFLDLDTCERCIGTDSILDEVMIVLEPVLTIAGYEVEYRKVKMETAGIAAEYGFKSSPTIRLNGQDICQSISENNCGCCSDISGTSVNCRVFEYKGENYEVPPKEMIAQAVLQGVFGSSKSECSCEDYEMPENLKDFFSGKECRSGCSCGTNCC